MSASIQVLVDGVWLTSFLSWGDLSYSRSWPLGCKEASWSITSRYGAHPTLLRPGAKVELRRGCRRVWAGTLQEPDWNGKDAQLTAKGPSGEGDGYQAFTNPAGSAASYNPYEAITAAIARGLDWKLTDSVPNYVLLNEPTDLYTVSGLLTATALVNSYRWGVDADRRVYYAMDKTANDYGPDYIVRPGVADLAVATDNYASHVVLRYEDVADNVVKTVSYPGLASAPTVYEKLYGRVEWAKSVVDLGPMATWTAFSIAAAIRNRSMSQPTWASGLSLLPGELLTRGGVPVDHARVRENQCVRVLGVHDPITHKRYIDFTIGNVSRNVDEKTLNIDPVDIAARTPEEVFTDLYEGEEL